MKWRSITDIGVAAEHGRNPEASCPRSPRDDLAALLVACMHESLPEEGLPEIRSLRHLR